MHDCRIQEYAVNSLSLLGKWGLGQEAFSYDDVCVQDADLASSSSSSSIVPGTLSQDLEMVRCPAPCC